MPQPLILNATCGTCAHYSKPGTFSARCQLIEWDYKRTRDWNVAFGTRRADNRCERWAALDAVEAAERRAA